MGPPPLHGQHDPHPPPDGIRSGSSGRTEPRLARGATAHPRGGWSCLSFGSAPARQRSLDAWEGLGAFAALARDRWSAEQDACVRRAAEFFLSRKLHIQGIHYEPWERSHWPVHYYYDVLVGLDLLTALGYGNDRRLRWATELLRKKRRRDGRWNLDALHPDVGGGMQRRYEKRPDLRPLPLRIESPCRPSKMITLRALTVLARIEVA